MRSISVVLVLLITQYGWVTCAESSEESKEDYLKDLTACPGGYCIKAYLCRNGTINVDGEDILEIRFGEEDPCEEFLMRCCAPDAVFMPRTEAEPVIPDDTIIPPPASCGANYPNGFMLQMKSNKSIAQFAEFPWMGALLQRKMLLEKEAYEYFCGGSLIHPKVVLTAAHCMINRNELDSVVVRLGEWDTVTENEPLAHQQYGVSKMIIHENFVNGKFHNDLALLILNEEAILNKHINLICLPRANDNFDDMRCMVSGWGKANFEPGEKYSEVLKKVELPVIPRDKCKKMFRSTRLGPAFRLHSSFMCAGGEPEVDVCKGDGGSPLACKSEDHFVQAGIVAWGLGCGEDGIPGAYVKVSNFVEWIQTQLQMEQID